MAENSVSDFSLFINHQVEAQEQIEARLWRLEALLVVAVMLEGFYELSANTLQSYFSVAKDLIEEVSKANQTSLSELLKARPSPTV